MLSLNNKHVQHVKMYLACKFKVNLITRLRVIALFSFAKFKLIKMTDNMIIKLEAQPTEPVSLT
jgi:hypothetical protein